MEIILVGIVAFGLGAFAGIWHLPADRSDGEVSPTWEIRQGDVLDRLREMPSESVHCVVTSPPYWGLTATTA